MELPVSPGASPRVTENQDVKKYRELRLEDQDQNLLIFLKYFSNHTYIIINTGFCLFVVFVFKARFGLGQRSQEGCLGSPRGG